MESDVSLLRVQFLPFTIAEKLDAPDAAGDKLDKTELIFMLLIGCRSFFGLMGVSLQLAKTENNNSAPSLMDVFIGADSRHKNKLHA